MSENSPLEKAVKDADVTFVQLPLPIFERELTPQERNMHGAYWDKLTSLVPNKFFSPDRPIFNFMEFGLGLPTLSAEVKNTGHSMGLVDLFGFSGSTIDYKEVGKVLDEAGPSRIFFMSPMTCGYDIFLNIAEMVKDRFPDSLVVGGGAHVAKLPERTLAEIPKLDVAVTDHKFRVEDLVNRYLKYGALEGISGIIYRDKEGNVMRSNHGLTQIEGRRKLQVERGYEDLDFDILPSRYADSSWARIYTMLGCKYQCAYCADVLHIGVEPEAYSMDKVMAQIDALQKRFGVQLFYIGDETFTYIPSHAREFAKRMGERKNAYWIAQTRVDCVDQETLEVMADNNCILLKFGAENGSDGILRSMRKGTTTKQIEYATRMAKDIGLNVFTYWMTGLPGETETTVQQSMDLQRRLFESGQCDLAEDVIFVPYPGTDIHANPQKYGITIEQKPWSQWREDMPSVTSTRELSSRRIYDLWLNKINKLGNLIRG